MESRVRFRYRRGSDPAIRAKHGHIFAQYGNIPKCCLDASFCLLRRHDVPSWSGRYKCEIQEGGYIPSIFGIISSAQVAVCEVYAQQVREGLPEGTVLPYAGAAIRIAFGSLCPRIWMKDIGYTRGEAPRMHYNMSFLMRRYLEGRLKGARF